MRRNLYYSHASIYHMASQFVRIGILLKLDGANHSAGETLQVLADRNRILYGAYFPAGRALQREAIPGIFMLSPGETTR